MCDLAYTLLVEQVERRSNTAQIAAAAVMAAGGEVEMPDPDEARQRFEEWLVAEPEIASTPADRETSDLLRALGVR